MKLFELKNFSPRIEFKMLTITNNNQFHEFRKQTFYILTDFEYANCLHLHFVNFEQKAFI